MKNTFLLAITTVTLFSCNSLKPGDSALNQEVPYKEAKNYFVKNNIDAAIANPKFENQQDFDQVFGMATTMGENGKPTPVDFSTEFVVAQIEDPSTQKVVLNRFLSEKMPIF